ncbi:MAG: DUF58 domain-containing protein [Ruminococcaceae bacterium]|nr:DUF58 domain-containing protein [Oscillospiraceae bacterium]
MKETSKSRAFLRLHKGAVLYGLLLVFAIVFTQALRSPASSMLFWFLILYLPVSFLYVLIGRLTIQVFVQADQTRVEKMTPVPYEMRVINPTPLVFPFVEAVLQMPQDDGIRCESRIMKVSLISLGSCTLKEETLFPYRGTYEVGMECIYISDFLHIFSMHLPVDIYTNILVMPRRLSAQRKTRTSATDIPNDHAALLFSTEKAEIGNIREYVPGDALKAIHWKLSSKTPTTLMVKEFNTNTSRQVYVLCDFSRAIPPEVFAPEEEKEEKKPDKKEKEAVKLDFRTPEKEKKSKKRKGRTAIGEADAAMIDELIAGTAEPTAAGILKDRLDEKRRETAAKQVLKLEEALAGDKGEKTQTSAADERASLAMGGRIQEKYREDMNEYCADGVAEMAIAVVENELRQGNEVTLIWTDSRMDDGVAAAVLTCPEDFSALYETFATTPPCDEHQIMEKMLPLITESLNVTIRICTSHLDPVSLGQYGAIPSLFGGAGSGCLAEVLLFNPEDRYESIALRREYVAMSRIQLAKDGVDLTELAPETDETGTVLKEVHNG